MTYMTAWTEATSWYFHQLGEITWILTEEEIDFISQTGFSTKDCMFLDNFEQRENDASKQWLSNLEELLEWKRRVKEIKLKLFPELDRNRNVVDEITSSFWDAVQQSLDKIFKESDLKMNVLLNYEANIRSIIFQLLDFYWMINIVRENNPRTPVLSGKPWSTNNLNSYNIELRWEEGIRKSLWKAIIKLMDYIDLVSASQNKTPLDQYQKALIFCHRIAEDLIHWYEAFREDFKFTSDRIIDDSWNEIVTITTIWKHWEITHEKIVSSSMGEELTENS